jgi:hypothetical protein
MEKMTIRKFANLLGKTLGYTNGIAFGEESKWTARKFNYPFIEAQLDGAFLVRNLNSRQEVKLLEAGLIASVKIAPKRWSSDESKVAIFWSAN